MPPRTASQRQQRHEWSSYAPSQVDSGLVANIQKLFSERIEIFAPVEFSKVSILTGIIKISLKVGCWSKRVTRISLKVGRLSGQAVRI